MFRTVASPISDLGKELFIKGRSFFGRLGINKLLLEKLPSLDPVTYI